MYTWLLAFIFGAIGTIAGYLVSDGQPKGNILLLTAGCGVLFAILGAFIGVSMDIVNVIKKRTTKPVQKITVNPCACCDRRSPNKGTCRCSESFCEKCLLCNHHCLCVVTEHYSELSGHPADVLDDSDDSQPSR